MNWVDIAIIVALALAAFEGWRSGLVHQVVMLAGFVAGLALAGAYGDSIGETFARHATWAHVAGFVVVLALVLWAPTAILLIAIAHSFL